MKKSCNTDELILETLRSILDVVYDINTNLQDLVDNRSKESKDISLDKVTTSIKNLTRRLNLKNYKHVDDIDSW